MDNTQILLHHLLHEYLVERDINFTSVNLRCLLQLFGRVKYWQGVGGQAVQGGLSCPPPRISERMDNTQILLHHLLQEYLVERDINFTSVNLRCLLQLFGRVKYWQGVGGQAVQGGLSCPPPRISERMDNTQILLHHLLQEYLVEKDINFIPVNLRCLLQPFGWVTDWQGVGGQAVQGGLSCPPHRISERMDNTQILLHHLLQEYLVERDINFISVNLRCLLQTFIWVMNWQGVGSKLARAVYLAPHLEFQREWIIRKFYYTIYYI